MSRSQIHGLDLADFPHTITRLPLSITTQEPLCSLFGASGPCTCCFNCLKWPSPGFSHGQRFLILQLSTQNCFFRQAFYNHLSKVAFTLCPLQGKNLILLPTVSEALTIIPSINHGFSNTYWMNEITCYAFRTLSSLLSAHAYPPPGRPSYSVFYQPVSIIDSVTQLKIHITKKCFLSYSNFFLHTKKFWLNIIMLNTEPGTQAVLSKHQLLSFLLSLHKRGSFPLACCFSHLRHSDLTLTGLECSTVKNSGLMRNFTGGDCNSNVSLDLEVEWGRTLSRRKSRWGRPQRLQGHFSTRWRHISIHFHLHFQRTKEYLYHLLLF